MRAIVYSVDGPSKTNLTVGWGLASRDQLLPPKPALSLILQSLRPALLNVEACDLLAKVYFASRKILVILPTPSQHFPGLGP